jgi:RNA polymerase sigma factor (sigma-70 family)
VLGRGLNLRGGVSVLGGVVVAAEVPGLSGVPPLDVESWCASVYPRLVAAMSLYCGTLEDAEDLAQETLSRAWEHWSTVGEHPAPESWAFRTAFNLANSRWRRRRIERRAHARLASRGTAVPTDVVDIEVRRAVAGLPARQREVVVLRFFVDLSVADTAAAMTCAEGTVKALTHQAIASLRRAGLAANVRYGDD